MSISISILRPYVDLIEITFAKAALFLEYLSLKRISIEIKQTRCIQDPA